jgi:co-chaperonin GroES (HSP10)
MSIRPLHDHMVVRPLEVEERTLGDLQGLLMGSVSHKVSHLADCVCLTVK